MKKIIAKKLTAMLIATLMLISFINISFLSTTVSAEGAPGPTVNFVALGDSISTGYGLTGYTPPTETNTAYASESFVELLKANKNFTTTNLAVDGLTSEQLALATNPNIMNAMQKALLQNANVISITIGGNDLLLAFYTAMATQMGTTVTPETLPIILATIVAGASGAEGTEAQAAMVTTSLGLITKNIGAIVGGFSTNLQTIIANLKSLNPTSKIIVQTIANPYKSIPNEVLSGAIDTGLSAFNSVISAGASTVYKVSDVYTAFKNSSDVLTNATNPTTPLDPHPNALGHSVIADTVYTTITARTQRTSLLSLSAWTSGSSFWIQDGETGVYTYKNTDAYAQGWRWQYDNNTSEYALTLDNVNFLVANNSAITFNGTAATPNPNISVNLIGKNKVISTNQGGGNYNSSGIYFKTFGTNVKPVYTFKGSGSLEVAGYRNGISIDTKGHLVIKDTTIVADSSTQSAMCTSSGNVTIENSNITASAGGGSNASVVGVVLDGDLTVTNSVISISLKDDATDKFALCGENVNITDNSTITINGGKSTKARGIYYKSDKSEMNISDSTVTISNVYIAIDSNMANNAIKPNFTNSNITTTSSLMSFPFVSIKPTVANSNVLAHSPEAIDVYGTPTLPEKILYLTEYVYVNPNSVLTVPFGQKFVISDYLDNKGTIINNGTIINKSEITSSISGDGNVIVAKYGGELTTGTLDLKTNTPLSNTAYIVGNGIIVWEPISEDNEFTTDHLTMINAYMGQSGEGLILPNVPITIKLIGNNTFSKIVGDTIKVTEQNYGGLNVNEMKISSYEQTSGMVDVNGTMTIASQNATNNSKLFTISDGSLDITGTKGSFSFELTDLDFVSSMVNTSGMDVVTDPVDGKLLSKTTNGKTIVTYATGTVLEDDLSNACTKVSFTKSDPLPPSGGNGGGYIPPVITEKAPQIIVDKDGNITATDKYGKPVISTFFELDGKAYYFGKDGNAFIGLNAIEDEQYFFNTDGTMVKSKFVEVSTKVNGKEKKQTYYFDKNGKSLTGLRSIKKVKYFFDANGVMEKSSFVSLVKEIDGEDVTQTYYFDKNGKSLTGLRTIKNAKYHFNTSGVMTRSKFVTITKTIDGKKVKQTYYFNQNGKSLTGKRTINDKVYTFNKNGILL